MLATLEFDLPEDEEAHLLAIHAVGIAATLRSIDETVRRWRKDERVFSGTADVLDSIRDLIRHELDAYGVPWRLV